MGEYLGKILDERDQIRVLASDGSTDLQRLLVVL